MRRTQRTRGFSLMELSIVLGIVGTVLGSLWGVITTVRENMRRDQALNQIIVSTQNIRDFYKGKAEVSTDAGATGEAALTSYLYQVGVLLPEQIRDRDAGIGNYTGDLPWGATAGAPGGTFAVSADPAGNRNSRSFTISLRSLSKGSCMELASKLTSASGPADLEEIWINGTQRTEVWPLSPDVTGDSSICKKTLAGDENNISLIYRLRQSR